MFRPLIEHGDKNILKLQQWMERCIDTDINVRMMAAKVSLSERTLLRRFAAATGLTPSAYVQQLRIEKARGFLEHSTMPISELNYKVGYQAHQRLAACLNQ